MRYSVPPRMGRQMRAAGCGGAAGRRAGESSSAPPGRVGLDGPATPRCAGGYTSPAPPGPISGGRGVRRPVRTGRAGGLQTWLSANGSAAARGRRGRGICPKPEEDRPDACRTRADLDKGHIVMPKMGEKWGCGARVSSCGRVFLRGLALFRRGPEVFFRVPARVFPGGGGRSWGI